MTMRVCSAKTIRGRWFSLVAVLALSTLAPAQSPETLARAYRDSPTPARRAALERYAAAHAGDVNGALARLALGITAYEQKDYPAAIQHLRAAEGRLPKLADYVAYFLAAARVEAQDAGVSARDLAPVHQAPVLSPHDTRAQLLEARALTAANAPAGAIAVLRAHYSDLPQPEAAMALAQAQQAAGSLPEAVAAYQFVYTQYPVSDAAGTAEAALGALREKLGGAYPQLTPRQSLERASRFLALRETTRARSEFRSLAAQLPPGVERDTARVRIGAVDYLTGNTSAAYRYLRSLDLPVCEADAERLYYLTECARQLGNDDEMMDFIKALYRSFPTSPWRFKALVTAGNKYLVVNKPDQYVPLYKAAYENFPTETQAPVCHWKVVFHSYVQRKHDARHRLRSHLEMFPGHGTAGAALYFLGRLSERENDWGAARACYDKLTSRFPNYYYAMLARDRLKEPRLADAAPSQETAKYLAAVPFPYRAPENSQPIRATTVRIERARLLRSAGLDNWAESEIRFGAKTDGQAPLLAVELARHADSPFARLRTMKSVSLDYLSLPFEDAGEKFWEYLFPLPYQNDVVSNARRHNLDPFLVAGLIRQESEFNPQAVSRAKAYGLTQVMPSTGRALARKVGIRRFSTRMLFQPSTNLKLGTLYLRSMLDKWDGKWEHTLASYNAGPNRVAEWITWNHCEEPAEFVESIPFTETREYVQAVLRNAALYRRIYEDRPPVAQSQATAKPAAKPKSKTTTRRATPAKKRSGRK